jgi:hypothetical protein
MAKKRKSPKANHDFYGMAYVPAPSHDFYGMSYGPKKKRRTKKKSASKKRLTKRRSKKRPSPAQMRARRAFVARARARAKTGMAGRMRAGKRYNPRTASRGEKALYARAMRAARAVGVGRKKKTGPKRKKKAQRSVTAAQVVAMAKKGSLQRWLCSGIKRTGCGSSGRVTAGKDRFYRVR